MNSEMIEDEEALVCKMMNALHSHIPEAQRPMSMSDLSDEQAVRAKAAVRAVILGACLSKPDGHHPNVRAAITATAPDGRMREALVTDAMIEAGARQMRLALNDGGWDDETVFQSALEASGIAQLLEKVGR